MVESVLSSTLTGTRLGRRRMLGESGREEVSGHHPVALMVPNICYRHLTAEEKQHQETTATARHCEAREVMPPVCHKPFLRAQYSRLLWFRSSRSVARDRLQYFQGHKAAPPGLPPPGVECSGMDSAQLAPQVPSPRARGHYSLPTLSARCPHPDVCPQSQGSVCKHSLRPRLVATCWSTSICLMASRRVK